MKKKIRIIIDAVESDPGLTAHDLARKLNMAVRSVSMILSHLYKEGMVERREVRERYCYYPGHITSVRNAVSEETVRRHEQYVASKVIGNRAYTCTHIDMLRILASHGDVKAQQEIQRREEVNA